MKARDQWIFIFFRRIYHKHRILSISARTAAGDSAGTQNFEEATFSNQRHRKLIFSLQFLVTIIFFCRNYFNCVNIINTFVKNIILLV